MWRHLSDAAVVDVIEGSAEARARAHVAGCEPCRVRVEDARQAWGWAAQAVVPEPVPSYWDVFRRRVARALVDAPAAPSRRPLWAAAAASVAVIALLMVVPLRGPVASVPAAAPAAPVLPAWSALPPADEDPGLPVLEHVVPLAAAATPAVECSDISECMAGLSDDESRALVDVLRQELRPGITL
ncbi:MAG TPA: hypothetical protein VGQ33_04575 [Vicinamibacteria bacterium]|nr:hypothetical protein [Vicinamibacteria bacterium]